MQFVIHNHQHNLEEQQRILIFDFFIMEYKTNNNRGYETRESNYNSSQSMYEDEEKRKKGCYSSGCGNGCC